MAKRDETVHLDEFRQFAEPALLSLVSLEEGPGTGGDS